MRIPHGNARKIADVTANPMLRWLQTFFSAEAAGDSGSRGERLASEWLRRERGFVVVTRNWRSPRDRRDEIDLVCRDGDVLVFVEVKARAANALVPGYHAVDERKKRAVKRAAETYLSLLHEKPLTFRFDVVEVSLPVAATRDLPEPEILHFENVPLFAKHFRG
jgi:putative endonuclease